MRTTQHLGHIRFGELADINPKTSTQGLGANDLVSFIPMSDVSESGDWTTRQQRQLKTVKAGFTAFRDGDTLFAKITPCMENGKGCHATNLANDIGFGSTEFHVLRAVDPRDARFVFHWSRSSILRLKAEAFMTGSAGQQRVTPGFLENFQIAELYPQERYRIAEVLDTLDESIRHSENRLQKLLSTREGFVVELLNQEDVISQAEHTLGEVCRSSGGSVQTGPFGSQLHAEDYKTEGTPIITVEHLGEGRIFHRNLPLVGEADRIRLQRYSLRAGDLVFSRVGAIDRCALVGKAEDGWLFSGRLLRVRAISDDVNPAYLSMYLNTEKARRWIRNHAVGSTMACLNTKILSGTPVKLPSKVIQDRIVAAVGALDDLLDRERLEVDKLRQAKSGLSVDLLTGHVRVAVGAPA